MFERFSDEARDTVQLAQSEARRLGQMWVGTEHVLLAVVTGPAPLPSAFAGHGLSQDRVEAAIAAHVDRTHAGDRQALSAIGIDLDRVQESLEGAEPSPLELQIDRARTWISKNRPPSDRRPRGNALPFTPAAKESLELALRESLRLRQSTIEPVHVALGMLRQGRGVAHSVLEELGVDVAALRDELSTLAAAAA